MEISDYRLLPVMYTLLNLMLLNFVVVFFCYFVSCTVKGVCLCVHVRVWVCESHDCQVSVI